MKSLYYCKTNRFLNLCFLIIFFKYCFWLVVIHHLCKHFFLLFLFVFKKIYSKDSTTQRKNSFLNSNGTTDSTQEFRIEHVWMGPAVYRHVQHISNDDHESTQSTLLGPLIEGMDYTFVGKASGSIGVSVRLHFLNIKAYKCVNN